MPPDQNENPLVERRLSDLEEASSKGETSYIDIDRRLTRLEINFENAKERAKEFVTRQEFTPIRMIVYGLAATALTGLLSAIMSRLFVK